MFNLGPGEVIVLILLGLIYFGPKTLPELMEGFLNSARPSVRAPRQAPHPRWSRSDWLLLGAALVLGSLAFALAASPFG